MIHSDVTGMVAGDERVEPLLDLLLRRDLAAVEVEIEPALLGADRAAGDREGEDDGEEVQAGVDAHVPMAALPVERRLDRLARLGQRLGLAGDVDDLALVVAIDGGGDGDRRSVGADEPPGIAGLAAAGGVEDGAVEDDAAAVVDGEHGGLDLGKVGVVAEEEFGGHDLAPWAAMVARGGGEGQVVSPFGAFLRYRMDDWRRT